MFFTKPLTAAFLLMTCLATASPLVLERTALDTRDVKELGQILNSSTSTISADEGVTDAAKRSPCQFLKRDAQSDDDGVDFSSCGN